MKNRLPPKRDVMLALLERAPSVFIHLDPRGDDVRVPPWFKKQPQLVLQVGLNMAIPIPDLSVDEAAVSCTLSFSRSPHFCYVPWRAVFALITEDSRGMVWPEDIPPEVAAQRAAAARRPALRALPDDSASAPTETPPAKEASKNNAGAKEPAARPRRRSKPQAETAVIQRRGPVEAKKQPDSAETGGRKRELPPYLRVVK
jgi:stringent starvation protein B